MREAHGSNSTYAFLGQTESSIHHTEIKSLTPIGKLSPSPVLKPGKYDSGQQIDQYINKTLSLSLQSNLTHRQLALAGTVTLVTN